MAQIKLNTLYTTLAGLALLGSALAQQQPAASPTPTPGKTPSTSKAKTPASTTKAQKPAPRAPKTALTTQKDKVSYAIGMNMGASLRRRPADLDVDLIIQGVRDALNGKTLLTEDEARSVFMQWQVEMRAKQEEQLKQAAEANKKEGEAFLVTNKAKEGVVTLPSGLQYKILSPGTGPKPAADDTVVVQYRGTLIDGKEFDSSAKHGGPATFPVNRVIKGWTEALQLMPVGSKWQLVIPPSLAYGERGAGADIGPNATLVFEVELLSIQEKKPAPQPTPGPDKTPEPAKTPSPEKK